MRTNFCRVVVDDFFGGQVALVADQQLVDVLASITVDFLQPLFDVVERLLVCAVVNDDDTVRAAIITRRDRAEPLLAGRVPLKVKSDGIH